MSTEGRDYLLFINLLTGLIKNVGDICGRYVWFYIAVFEYNNNKKSCYIE